MNIDKELFKLFQENKDQYDLYKKTLEFVYKVLNVHIGKENAKFYDLIRQLKNSINNAGWEIRHHDQIDFLNKISDDISEKYEEYLG